MEYESNLIHEMKTPKVSTDNGFAAAYRGDPPSHWTAGATQVYTLTVTNTGSDVWHHAGRNAVRLGVHFGRDSDLPHKDWLTDERIPIPHDVAPGMSLPLRLSIAPPPNPGKYILRHRFVAEGAAWFNLFIKTPVEVQAFQGQKAPRVNGSLPGVNVCGYLRNESGLGAAARGYIRALEFLGVPVSLKDLSHLSVNRSEDNSLSGLDRGPVHDVSVFCVNADQHFRIMDELGMEFFRHRYNIGIWAWELPRFPEEWYDCFAYYNEIWVASSFIANALAPVSPIPIVRIPPVLNRPSVGSRLHGRRHLGVNSKELVYLFVFDFHSYFERKNPLALIRAFKKAFRASQPVRLVIKCVNQGSNKDGFAAMKEESRGHRISIHSGYWRTDELQDLMAACDVYVSLHRSEGTGLTISDAMALGKPVIATNWSGNTDFMDESNGYPVRYKLVRLTKNHGPYHKGEIWAEPSIDHAAELMRFVYEHPEEARKRGKAAAKQIQTKFSEQRVAGLIKDRLALIARQGGAPSIQAATGTRDLESKYARYRQLIPRILNTVNATVPAGATVMVINKGDEELLKFNKRRGWHFPRDKHGDYAGYYPIDSSGAIAHLESLKAKGASYLVIPNTAAWWLQFYVGLRRHLESRYWLLKNDDDCTIYQLVSTNGEKARATSREAKASLGSALNGEKAPVRSRASKALLRPTLSACSNTGRPKPRAVRWRSG